MEDLIRNKAAELGFSACAFTDCSDLLSEQSRFSRWLSEGCHADMHYMGRHAELRLHPAQLCEGCVSVIVLLMNYHRTDYARQRASAYRVSEYALGRDYHLVMRERLHLLARFVETLGAEVRTRCCVDTAPVMEKVLAARAGLGWIGKNTLLLNGKGSLHFIGEVFTSLPLRPDAPVENRCGSCTACVDACPGGALSSGRLDARRCLSYQTIERRELTLPDAAAQVMGRRIYGCDCCQQACPYNRQAEETQVEDFRRRPAWFAWTDADWQSMREEDFNRHFADSAMRRIGYEHLMENIRRAE